MSNIIPLRQSYDAKLFTVPASGLLFKIAGTLDGFVDLAIIETSGRSATYSVTIDEARLLADRLLNVAKDIQSNCLFDRDSLLHSGKYHL